MACSQELSLWGSSSSIISQAVPGDLIEFNRKGKGYRHWALYIGGGRAIHVFLPSKMGSTAEIVEQSLEDICDGDPCRINNMEGIARKRGFEVRNQQEIVKDAKDSLGQSVPYHVLNHNCEYFVTACRYGTAFCSQVEGPSDALLTWGSVLAVAGGLAMGAAVWLRSHASQARNRYQNRNQNQNL